ncbi:MAG: hypothetical protein V4596_00515 [Bdellovibrionota bacterium]
MFLFIIGLFLSHNADAASCCSGGTSTTAIITNNDQAQFTASMMFSSVHAQARTDGKWQKLDGDKTREIFTMEGSALLGDRTQISLSAPFQKNSYESSTQNANGSGVGDVKMSFAYEAVTDWDYSKYRPKIYVYSQAQLPTGKSIYETQELEAVDSTGTGLLGLGVGAVAVKTIKKWDYNANIFTQKLFDKSFGAIRIEPGNIYQTSVGVGYNYTAWRFGINNLAYLQDSGKTSGMVDSKISIERYVSSTLLVSYLYEEDLSVTASYSDQTLIGKPVNTQLSRAVFLSLQKHWPR